MIKKILFFYILCAYSFAQGAIDNLDLQQEPASLGASSIQTIPDRWAQISMFAGMTNVRNIPAQNFFDFIALTENQDLSKQVSAARAAGMPDDAIISMMTNNFDTLIVLENELLKIVLEAAMLQKAASWEKKKKIFKYVLGFVCVGVLSFAAYKLWQKNNNNAGNPGGGKQPNPQPNPQPQRNPRLQVRPNPQPQRNPRLQVRPIFLNDCIACFTPLDKTGKNAVPLEACGHAACCNACMLGGITGGLDSNDLLQIRCAVQGCQKQLAPHDLKQIGLPGPEVDKYDGMLLRDCLAKEKAKNCPTPDCKAVFFVDAGDKFITQCNACHNEYCVGCLKNHPLGRACGLSADEEKMKTYFEESRTRKQCPDCKAILELKDGCKYVRCCSWKASDKEICVACGQVTQYVRNHHNVDNDPANQGHHGKHACCSFVPGDAYLSQEELALDKEFQAAWDADTWNKADFDRRRVAARAAWAARMAARRL